MGGLHLTEISHHFNLFITISITLFLFSFGGFDFKSKYHWRIFYATLFTISLISCLIGILKSWTICRNDKNQAGVLERCKRDYTIGSGSLLLFACIPYFVICYFHFNIKIALYVFFVFNISSVVLHYAFISKLKRLCRLKYKRSHCVIATCFHLLVLISIFTFKVVFDRQIAFVILCFQLTFLYALIFNTITLWTILGNRIELMNIEMRIIENGEAGDDRTPMGTNVRERDSSQTGAENVHEVCCSEIDETSSREIGTQATCLKCDLCMLEYDRTIQQQTPLIPTSCGHVLCHKCIDIIMNQYDQQHFYCPFCQSCG